MAEAGWYIDPQDPQSVQFFDGLNWTGHRRPAAAAAPLQAAPTQDATQEFFPAPDGPQHAAPAAAAPAFDTQAPWPTQTQAQQPPPPGASTAALTPEADAWQTTRRADIWPGPPAPGPWPAAAQPPTWPGGSSELGGWPAAPASAGAPDWPAASAGAPGWPAASAAGPGWPGAPTSGSWPPPPPAPRRRQRGPVVLAFIAVAVVAAGLITWLVWPSNNPPSLTYQGKEIAAAGDVLKTAENNVNALVAERHGAKNADTRCYYAQPETPASGAKKTDIDDNLRCGPVLFIDGDRNSTYLRVPLTSTASGSKVTLDSQKSLSGISPAAVGTTFKLVRPDGKSAPAGNGGLDVPKPPAAQKNVLTVAPIDSASAPPAIGNARMVGKDTKVTLEAAGEVPRYGKSDDARSAPAGQKLLAFQLSYGSGAVSGAGAARARVSIDGGASRAVPETSGSDEYAIVAVPTTGTAVLQLTDAGYTQTLTLPGGKAGSKNIAVLARNHRTAYIGTSAAVPIHLSNGNGSANVTFQATLSFVSLDFWIPGHENQHPIGPGNAILSLRLSYTDSSNPGSSYGFDPQLLRLTLPSGRVLQARNVAGGDKISDVFEVPGDYSHGTLQITGTENVDGITVQVTSPKSFKVTIPAG
ncbi:MAG: hypothetical protein QOF92_4310 [Pseudonocardiales bacterium]|nr:hypothetical protein [Pseudonocardiales bacterium]